jgi:hypothetical protein
MLRGEVRQLRMPTVVALAAHFKVPRETFLYESTDPEPAPLTLPELEAWIDVQLGQFRQPLLDRLKAAWPNERPSDAN